MVSFWHWKGVGYQVACADGHLFDGCGRVPYHGTTVVGIRRRPSDWTCHKDRFAVVHEAAFCVSLDSFGTKSSVCNGGRICSRFYASKEGPNRPFVDESVRGWRADITKTIRYFWCGTVFRELNKK